MSVVGGTLGGQHAAHALEIQRGIGRSLVFQHAGMAQLQHLLRLRREGLKKIRR